MLQYGFPVVKELMTKVNKSEKFAQLTFRSWSRKFLYRLHLVFEWSNPSAIDVMSEESQFLNSEYALQWIYDDAIFVEASKNWAQMSLMFLSTRAGNKDFVNISVGKWEATKNLHIQPLVMPSPFLTSLFQTVSLFLIAVSVTTRVPVDTSDVWKLETLALIVYIYDVAIVWITNIVGIHLSRAIPPPLTTKLPTFPRIIWQVRHHEIPVNLLLLTTISMTLDWLKHQWLPGEHIRHLCLPALTTLSPPFFLSDVQPLFHLRKSGLCFYDQINGGCILWSCPLAEKYIHCPLRQSWEGVCVRAEQTAQGLHWWNSAWVNCLDGQHCTVSPTLTETFLLLETNLVRRKEILLSCCGRDAPFSLD